MLATPPIRLKTYIMLALSLLLFEMLDPRLNYKKNSGAITFESSYSVMSFALIKFYILMNSYVSNFEEGSHVSFVRTLLVLRVIKAPEV